MNAREPAAAIPAGKKRKGAAIMPFMMCKKGHLFNADIHDSCNVCAGEEGEITRTIIIPDAEPEASAGQSNRTVVHLPGANEDLRKFAYGSEILPVVGWLVIITGPGAGRDFRLIPGQNYIGRDKDMEVCLDFGAGGDQSVSRREHALVVYDIDANECYLSDRSQSRNLPRLNGKTIRSATTLKSGDIIQVGGTRFLFAPLCGSDFNWGDSGAAQGG